MTGEQETVRIPKQYEIPSANLLKMYHQLTSVPAFQISLPEMSHALNPCPPA